MSNTEIKQEIAESLRRLEAQVTLEPDSELEEQEETFEHDPLEHDPGLPTLSLP